MIEDVPSRRKRRSVDSYYARIENSCGGVIDHRIRDGLYYLRNYIISEKIHRKNTVACARSLTIEARNYYERKKIAAQIRVEMKRGGKSNRDERVIPVIKPLFREASTGPTTFPRPRGRIDIQLYIETEIGDLCTRHAMDTCVVV